MSEEQLNTGHDYLLVEGWRELHGNPEYREYDRELIRLARYSWDKLDPNHRATGITPAEITQRWRHVIEDVAEFIFDPQELVESRQVDIVRAAIRVASYNIEGNGWITDGLRFRISQPDDEGQESRIFDVVSVYASEEVDAHYLERLFAQSADS